MIESNNYEEVDPDGIEKMGYEVSNWEPELNDILVCRNIVDNILLENEPLNNERNGKLLNIDHSLLNNIDKMITVSDPCNLCCWRKDRNPSIVVVCSGAEEQCKFKYEFFAEWPEYLLSEINKTQMLLDCDTLEKYAQLTNILFSVKYYVHMCNKYCEKKKGSFHLPHSVYGGSCMMCILNHHAAHIYLCGDVRRTVYGQNIQNSCEQIYIPLSETTEKYTNNIQNLCRQRYVPLSGKNIQNLCR